MSLHLDARQRAMLQEMGVTVWNSSTSTAAPSREALQPPKSAPTLAPSARMTPVIAEMAMHDRPTSANEKKLYAPPSPATSASPTATGPGWKLHPPLPLYPQADPRQTPVHLGTTWLIVAECLTPDTPLDGEAGRLLDNMLRAMQLHRHPRVFLCALERMPSNISAPSDQTEKMGDFLATLQPSMVLMLGHVAARTTLGRNDPLGRLRANPHSLAGSPAIVSYDPAFLLRSQDAKAAAWADLCKALAMVKRD